MSRLHHPVSIPGLLPIPKAVGSPLVLDSDGNVLLNYGSGQPGDGLAMHWWDAWSAAGGPANDGCYPQGATVIDDGWLAIANKDTCDRPAPQEQGNFAWLLPDAPSWLTGNVTDSAFMEGVDVTTTQWAQVNRYRVWGIASQPIQPIVILNYGTPDETLIVEPEFIPATTGWIEVPIGTRIVEPNTQITFAVVRRPPTGTPTTFGGTWDYKQKDDSPVSEGEIWHGGAGNTRMRISTTDDDGDDRSAELATLKVGDTIDGGGVTWRIVEIESLTGAQLQILVDPNTRLPENKYTFTFTVYPDGAIDYPYLSNFWSGDPNIRGFTAADGDPNNIVFDQDAYGVDISSVPLVASDDWDIMSSFGEGGGGGGGLTEGEADGIYLRRDGGNTMLGDLYFGDYGDIGFDENNQGVSLRLGQTNATADSVIPFVDFHRGDSTLATRLISNTGGFRIEQRIANEDISLLATDSGGTLRTRIRVAGAGSIDFFDPSGSSAGRLNASLVRFDGVYTSTVTFTPNVFVDATGRLFRSTSVAANLGQEGSPDIASLDTEAQAALGTSPLASYNITPMMRAIVDKLVEYESRIAALEACECLKVGDVLRMNRSNAPGPQNFDHTILDINP